MEATGFPMAAAAMLPGKRSLVIANDEWHPGIIGILAGKLRERYNVPVVVIGAGGKGSGRSAHDFDMGTSFHMAKDQGLLLSGGGHVGAGGLTLKPGMLEEFAAFMEQRALAMQIVPVEVDGDIPASMIGSALVLDIEAMEPFGIGNSKPVWLVRNLVLTEASWIGKTGETLRIVFQSVADRARFRSVMFSAKGGPFEALPQYVGQTVDAILEISRDTFRRESTAQNPLCNIVVKDIILR